MLVIFNEPQSYGSRFADAIRGSPNAYNLLDYEHPNALLLIYPHLGYDFQEYKETAGFIDPKIYPYWQTQVE